VEVVHVLYQENDWVYVISEDSREGFIPHSYTAQFGSQVFWLLFVNQCSKSRIVNYEFASSDGLVTKFLTPNSLEKNP
jgi:hypothetical protein